MMMSSHNGGESSGSSFGGGSGEFEIARVLASLRKHDSAAAAVAVEEEMRGSSGARSGESVGQSGGGGGGNTNCWGSKGKRWTSSNKRVKEFSSSLHSSEPSVSPLPFDLNVDQPTIFQEECQSLDVKPEKSYESSEHGRVCNSAHNTGRSRHNLTEAEKEARRIRRILANRESARQTIRRRQAFHEELTRKAAELASENERLKRNKDLAVKEFQSLQTTNQKLKGQLSQTLGFKLGENKGEEVQPSCPGTPNPHSTNWAAQFVYKNLSASPYVFPACLSPSDMKVSNLSPCRFIEQKNSPSINGQNMPWCILPCPVFLPVHDIKNFSSLHIKDRDEGASVDSNHVHSSPSSDYSPSSVIRCLHDCHLVSPADRISSGLSSAQDGCRNGFHRYPFGFSLDGGGQKMVPCWSRGDFALEREDCVTPHTRTSTNISSATCIDTASEFPEKRKERVLKKRERNVAGAEARKKRKELMKLKSRLHYQLINI